MSKRLWLCKLGMHNWWNFGYMEDSRIIENIQRELYPEEIKSMVTGHHDRRSLYHNRVCMCCEKLDDALDQRHAYWRVQLPLDRAAAEAKKKAAEELWDQLTGENF